MYVRKISATKYPYPTTRNCSNKEITIRILSISVRITDIHKISIRRYTSAYLWQFLCISNKHP